MQEASLRLTGVTFDLWQTLIYEKASEEEEKRAIRISAIGKILKENGFIKSFEEIENAYHICGKELREIWNMERDISCREQIERILFYLKVGNEFLNDKFMNEIEIAYVSPIFEKPPFLIEGVIECLSHLREMGLKLGLVCNTGRTPGYALRVVLEKIGIIDFFSSMSFSDETKMRKPNPVVFHRILESLGVLPEQSIHIGDLEETDVIGAKKAGMMAGLFIGDQSTNMSNNIGNTNADMVFYSFKEVEEFIKRNKAL